MTATVEPEQDDVTFLERLADRLSSALYYVQLGPIGMNGSVSPGLTHDDYDGLRALARRMRIEALEKELRVLKGEKS